MSEDELQELADIYGFYTRKDVDNEINHIKDLLNRSNLRLAEEQIENEELKKSVTEKTSEIEILKSKIKHIYDFNLCCDISRDRQSKEIIDTFQCLFDY